MYAECLLSKRRSILLVVVLEYDVSSIFHVSWPTFQLLQYGHTAILKAAQRFDTPKIVKQQAV